MYRYWLMMVWLLALIALTGCSAPQRRAEVPLGAWSGEGVFVADHWQLVKVVGSAPPGSADAPARPHVVENRSYKTWLKIDRPPGGDELRLEILSWRGTIAQLEGDRTHLIVFLKPDSAVGEGRITLYRMTRAGLSLDEKPPDIEAEDKSPIHASCMRLGRETVLQIQYMDDFHDVLRFRGSTVLKTGAYAPEDGSGLIHWTERLRKSTAKTPGEEENTTKTPRHEEKR